MCGHVRKICYYNVHFLTGFCKGSFPKKSLGVADSEREEEPLHGGISVQNVDYDTIVRSGPIALENQFSVENLFSKL